jgi:hypothetical protein
MTAGKANKHKEDGRVNKCLHNNLKGKGKCKQELHTHGK